MAFHIHASSPDSVVITTNAGRIEVSGEDIGKLASALNMRGLLWENGGLPGDDLGLYPDPIPATASN